MKQHHHASVPLPLWAWALLYVAIFMGLRFLLSPNLGTDDVEAAVFAQGWHLGYNPKQPPLYTWLLLALYQLFGPSLLAHELLRYGLLFLAILGLGRTTRLLGGTPRTVTLSPLVLALLFPIGWGAQLGFTHTLLLMATLFWSLAAFLDLEEKPSLLNAVEFGLAVFAGIMSKYNFLLIPAGFGLAALTLPKHRKILTNPLTLAALFFAVMACLPYGGWLTTHMGNTAGVRIPPPILNRGYALLGLAASMIGFLSPLILLLPIAGLRVLTARPSSPDQKPEQALLWRGCLIMLAFLVFGIVIGLIPEVKARYLHPVLLPLLPLILLRLQDHATSKKALRRFVNSGLGFIAFMAFALIIQGQFEPNWCKNCRWHTNMPALAEQVRASGFESGSIIASDEHIAGNLRMAFPDATIWTPAYKKALPVPTASPCLAIRTGPGTVGSFEVRLPMLRRPRRTSTFSWMIAPECSSELLQWVTEPRPVPLPARAGTQNCPGNCRKRPQAATPSQGQNG